MVDSRHFLPVLLLVTLSCGGEARRAGPVLPAAVEGGWTLASPSDAGRAVYQGPMEITVVIQTTSGQATAFEMVQKHQPQPGSLVFHHDRYFVTVSAPGADNATLNRFAEALEKAAQW